MGSSMKRSATFVVRLAALATLCASLSVGPVARFSLAAEDGAKNPVEAALKLKLQATAVSSTHCFTAEGLTAVELTAFEKLPTDAQATVLRVYAASPLEAPPPIAGTLRRSDADLVFTPKYPLVPGLEYRAVLDRGQLSSSPAKVITERFHLDQLPAGLPTAVTQIYPTIDRLPENQLKFYLRFSQPMCRGEAYQHVRLLDESGRPVDGAFLELGEELWDGDQQRFTLLFDPGRVKRGLKPREDLGPVLVEGRSYILQVDAKWRDAEHRALVKPVEKQFSVGKPDETPIDPLTWKIVVSPAGSTEPLAVRFGEPLDIALLERMVWIDDASGQKVAGKITTAEHQSVWKFTPQSPWGAGSYQLVADTRLEDLAGNSIGRAFEVDEFAPVKTKIESQTVKLPFEIKTAR